MYVLPNLGNDWRTGAVRFLKWIRSRGWKHQPWIVVGKHFMCVGVIGSYSLEDNDNEITI
jgi:hypothetical protein